MILQYERKIELEREVSVLTTFQGIVYEVTIEKTKYNPQGIGQAKELNRDGSPRRYYYRSDKGEWQSRHRATPELNSLFEQKYQIVLKSFPPPTQKGGTGNGPALVLKVAKDAG